MSSPYKKGVATWCREHHAATGRYPSGSTYVEAICKDVEQNEQGKADSGIGVLKGYPFVKVSSTYANDAGGAGPL